MSSAGRGIAGSFNSAIHVSAVIVALIAFSALPAQAATTGEAEACRGAAQQGCEQAAARRALAPGSRIRSAAVSTAARRSAATQARERAARRKLIQAGHIPPPGRMTRQEVFDYLKAYQREHPYEHWSIGTYLQIAGRLEQGYIVTVKPSDMQEPEWIRRSGVALNVLSWIPVGRMGSVVKGLASRLARVAAGGLGALRAEAHEAVARAVAMVGPGSGAVYGTRVHSALRLQIRGSPNLRAEVSYLNGQQVRYATRGSVRLDIVAYSKGNPVAIFDLKTGTARLTAARIRQIQSHLPPSMRNVTIEELRIR